MKEIFKQKRNFILLCYPLGILILILAKRNRDIAEYVFARGVYRVYGWIFSHINGILPFSVGEILLILFVIGMAAFPIVTGIFIIRSKRKLVTLVSSIRHLLIILGVVFLWFMIGAGTNYYRYEFSEFSGLKIQKSTVDELYQLCMELAEKTNKARADLGIADDEVFVSKLTNRERAEEAKKAMEKLSEKYEILEGYYPYAKSVFFSRTLSEFNITGVYFPWTVEANVNVDTVDYTKGACLCHELSHLRGFMREDEANFIGYLAAVNSDSAELRYSGYMSALVNAGNQLYDADKDKYYEVRSTYCEGIIKDFSANSVYWAQFKDTTLSKAGEKMNDTYLKINNVQDGTKSYGRMVDLLLAEWRAKQ
ncbi:MAG: DUF3810 domain-containing protein [Lachnospiraceae bacterium]|nr:DUF3810 domain-containing protein [Lachnospiraceae bacterium]